MYGGGESSEWEREEMVVGDEQEDTLFRVADQFCGE